MRPFRVQSTDSVQAGLRRPAPPRAPPARLSSGGLRVGVRPPTACPAFARTHAAAPLHSPAGHLSIQSSGSIQGEPSGSSRMPAPDTAPAVHMLENLDPLVISNCPLPSLRPSTHPPSYFEPSAWVNIPMPWRLSSFHCPSYLPPPVCRNATNRVRVGGIARGVHGCERGMGDAQCGCTNVMHVAA